MSIEWTTYVRAESPYSGSVFAVHMALADRARPDVCWPKMETIARDARVSVSSAEKAVKRLREDGHLVVSKRNRQNYYRLVRSNTPVTTTGQTRNPDGSDPYSGGVRPVTTTGAYRTITEPSVEPSEEPTTPAEGGKETTAMRGTIGASDDADPMPEFGMTPERKKNRFESVPRVNTQPWAIYQWELAMINAQAGRQYLVKALRRTVKNLHEDGYSYEEIVLLMQTFWTKYAQDVRAKRGEIDPVVMFSTRLGQLKKQVEPTIRGMQSGETAVDRGRAEMNDLMKRMGMTEENQ